MSELDETDPGRRGGLHRPAAQLGWRSWLVSGFIAAMILAQLATFALGTYSWPFMAYMMYSEPRSSPPQSTDLRVFARFPGETQEVELTYEDAGLHFFAHSSMYVKPLVRGDESVVPEYLERIERVRGERPVELRIDAYVNTMIDGEIVLEIIPHPIALPHDQASSPEGDPERDASAYPNENNAANGESVESER